MAAALINNAIQIYFDSVFGMEDVGMRVIADERVSDEETSATRCTRTQESTRRGHVLVNTVELTADALECSAVGFQQWPDQMSTHVNSAVRV
ncbi:HEAT repeat-containing protein 6 [Dorcoceras hygrometricum]|uniref:HEAT repeat-containing protein 6 n=1 Tax=Dorcoceras hygrometricum TaxID=472368 RepID=A0A2Z7CT95_9LAMI|nr:HEAT repeat-containing protein 6 [Dorcoceras hygrometricum]